MKTGKLKVTIAPKTFNYLTKLGIPANLDGYRYLAYILQNHLEEVPECKIVPLYERVGKAVGSTGSRVERALRHMVEISWLNITDRPLRKQLENSTPKTGNPTVSSYLVAVAYDFMNYLTEDKGV